MTNRYKDCRKSKRRINPIQKKYREGSYVISCNGHPSIVKRHNETGEWEDED